MESTEQELRAVARTIETLTESRADMVKKRAELIVRRRAEKATLRQIADEAGVSKDSVKNALVDANVFDSEP